MVCDLIILYYIIIIFILKSNYPDEWRTSRFYDKIDLIMADGRDTNIVKPFFYSPYNVFYNYINYYILILYIIFITLLVFSRYYCTIGTYLIFLSTLHFCWFFFYELFIHLYSIYYIVYNNYLLKLLTKNKIT